MPKVMKKSLLRNRVTNYVLTIMKISTLVYITACCLCATTWASTSYGQRLAEQKVTVNFKNLKLDDALEKLTEGTGFKVAYSDNLLNKAASVSLSVNNGSLLSALQQLLEPQHLSFSEVGNVIVLKKAPAETAKPAKTIRGTVKDTTGVTLVGVTVRVKDKPTIATSTDVNGKYVLEVPDGAILTFNYMGYRTVEIAVGKENVVDVVMHSADSFLEEVAIVGFGTQKKISLVGAQGTISVKDLKQPSGNLTNSLGGRVAGLVSVQRSGELGFNDAQIYIRGISTFTNTLSAPLTLVDGVPRDIANVDPEDIESFSILKDASATAVYGVRGANGVILITTKKGKGGRPTYNIRYTEGITAFTTLPEFTDGPTYMQMSNEALVTRGGTPVYSQDAIDKTANGTDPYLYPNVDWMSEVFNKTGHNRNVNANINGGSGNASYYVGLGYYDEKGLYKTEALSKYDPSIYLKRYNVTSNLSLKPSSTTTIELGIQGYLNNVNYPASSVSTIFNNAYFQTPVSIPVQYPDGKVADLRSGGLKNPWASLTQTGYANQWRSQVFSNLRITQGLPFITKGLSVGAMFSFDAYNYTSNRYTKTPDTYLATGRDVDGNFIYDQTAIGTEFLAYDKSPNGSRTLYSEASINYNRDFGKHNITGMFLYNQSDKINTFANDLEGSLPYRFRGLAGRFTYGYANKYFAEANFGYNGSENFYPGKQYGFFPSGGIAWVLSEEQFFSPLKNTVQLFKLRFSHGIVGNSLIDGRRFAYLSTVATNPGGYTFGQSMNNTYAGKDFGEYAVDVQWETSKKTNLGLDLRLLKDKLAIQADLFKEHRSGIFLRRTSLPAYVGMLNAPFGNVGVIDNKGIDGSVTYNNKIGQVSLSLLGNFTYNRNKVVEDDLPSWQYPWLERKGRKVGQRYGYVALGLFQSDDEVKNSPLQTGDVRAGDIKYKDINGDGVINSYDQVPIGYGNIPEIIYGFGFTIGYKAFTLSTLFQGAANVDFLLNGEGILPFQQGLARGNLFSNITDHWSLDNPNPNAFYPRLASGAINDNYATSSWWVKRADYLRLKSVQLSYNLPKNWMKRAGFKGASVFLQGTNVLTFSKFKLWDVELDNGRGDKYPNTSAYNAGFTLNF